MTKAEWLVDLRYTIPGQEIITFTFHCRGRRVSEITRELIRNYLAEHYMIIVNKTP